MALRCLTIQSLPGYGGKNIGDASVGAKKPHEAMDIHCEAQEKALSRLERAGAQGDFGPKLNEEKDPCFIGLVRLVPDDIIYTDWSHTRVKYRRVYTGDQL